MRKTVSRHFHRLRKIVLCILRNAIDLNEPKTNVVVCSFVFSYGYIFYISSIRINIHGLVMTKLGRICINSNIIFRSCFVQTKGHSQAAIFRQLQTARSGRH